MSDINSSLIGFLKKKTLFSESPAKSLRFKQKSKQKKSLLDVSKSSRNHLQKNTLKAISQSSSKIYKQQISDENYRQPVDYESVNHSLRIDRQSRFNNSFQNHQVNQTMITPRRNFNFNLNNNSSKSNNQNKDQQNSKLWTGLVNYSSTFQSARIQSVQCLEGMSIKIKTQLSNIDYKINSFHNRMRQILDKQFIMMKQKIIEIVEKVFQESEKSIRIYIKSQQQFFANQFSRMKDLLKQQFQKIQVMKQDINKPTWKKVVGQLLSTQMEQKLEALINKSQAINLSHWQISDISSQKIQSLQYILKDIIKLNQG